MIENFKNLSSEEAKTMMDAVPLVTVLISGADGDFSKAEKDWATKLTQIRSYKSAESMSAYYEKLEEDFSERVENLIETLPDNVKERNAVISDRLAALNTILPKVDNNFAYRFYKNLLSFAEHVAKADGGFLRFASINKEEKKWLELSMINPVTLEEDA